MNNKEVYVVFDPVEQTILGVYDDMEKLKELTSDLIRYAVGHLLISSCTMNESPCIKV